VPERFVDGEYINIYTNTLYAIVEEISKKYYMLILTYSLQRDEVKICKCFLYREI